MAIKDWNGFKKSGDTYIPNDATARAGVTATVDLMKDTTGWIGKNECVNNAVSKTENGVTWTVNADKSISAYGQPTEGDAYIDVNSGVNVSANGIAWICKGCPSDGGNDKYYSQLRLSNPDGTWHAARTDTGNGYQLTTAEVTANVKIQYRCVIPSGAPAIPQSSPIVFRPMIISPEQYALNPVYRPYHESVELSKYNRSEANILGAKNIKINEAYNRVVSGITVVVNKDKSITVSGTAAADVNLGLINGWNENWLDENSYILSDGVGFNDGNNAVYTVIARKKGASGSANYSVNTANDEHEKMFTVKYSEYDYFTWLLYVKNGTVITNPITVKPMIRLATDPDSTYEPPAMTNRELTEHCIKHKSYDFTYTTSTETGNVQNVNVLLDVDKSKIVSVWNNIGGTNDEASCSFITDGSNYAKVFVRNVFGHSSSTSINAVLHILYKD